MKICIVTGGSGGHIFPALTFADGLKEKHEITFIGNDHKMESWIIPEHHYDFKAIHNQGLQGSKLDRVRAVFSQFKAIKQAKKYGLLPAAVRVIAVCFRDVYTCRAPLSNNPPAYSVRLGRQRSGK